jgi:O-antigen/teichoic acid export membrane protein
LKENASGADRIIDELHSRLRTLLRGGGLTFGGVVLRRLIAVVYVIILTGFLGASGYGAYMLLLSAVSIMAVIATLGLQQGTMRFVSKLRAEQEADQVGGLVRISSGLGLVASALMVLAGWAASDFIAEKVFRQPALGGYLRWAVLAVPAVVLCALWLSATRGFHRVEETVWVSNLFEPAARIVIFLALALAGLGLGAAVGSYVGAAVGSALVAGLALRRLLPSGGGRMASSHAWALLSFSAPLMGSAMVGIIAEWADTLMLGYFTVTTQVGIYNVALRVAALNGMIHHSFNTIFAPIVSELLHRKEMEGLGQLFKIDTRWVFTLTFPIFLLVILLRKEILVLFGLEFTQGSLALIILSSAIFFNASVGGCGAIIRMAGWTRMSFVNTLVSSVSNVLLNLVLIPRFGIVGAALATGFSFVLNNALNLGQVWWYLRILPYDRKWVKPVVAGLGAGLLAYGLQAWMPLASTALSLAVPAVVFGACYLGLLILQKLEREDRIMLRLVRAKIIGKELGP